MRVFGLITLLSLCSPALLSSAAALPAKILTARQSESPVVDDPLTSGLLDIPESLLDKRQLGE